MRKTIKLTRGRGQRWRYGLLDMQVAAIVDSKDVSEHADTVVVNISNRPVDGWKEWMFTADSDPRFANSQDGMFWCISGLRFAGVKFKDGGRLWTKAVAHGGP